MFLLENARRQQQNAYSIIILFMMLHIIVPKFCFYITVIKKSL